MASINTGITRLSICSETASSIAATETARPYQTNPHTDHITADQSLHVENDNNEAGGSEDGKGIEGFFFVPIMPGDNGEAIAAEDDRRLASPNIKLMSHMPTNTPPAATITLATNVMVPSKVLMVPGQQCRPKRFSTIEAIASPTVRIVTVLQISQVRLERLMQIDAVQTFELAAKHGI
ncbi:hypothetical protein BGZ97_007118 [Linnemannia gamsii]|uniref:Uncharacterized protein n=1 Tax=Linnemannia gamsii TaxID=64522 RepID=A0A9P6QSJ2_9FUNG|nr:hypothetical protein BGX30_002367 [Mortierella sp. GBA39]KAG0287367.1 hypothetical protein BGZ97_007118 [Linnemannia gamsii]